MRGGEERAVPVLGREDTDEEERSRVVTTSSEERSAVWLGDGCADAGPAFVDRCDSVAAAAADAAAAGSGVEGAVVPVACAVLGAMPELPRRARDAAGSRCGTGITGTSTAMEKAGVDDAPAAAASAAPAPALDAAAMEIKDATLRPN